MQIGTKVKIAPSSIYYKENSHHNPREVQGEIYLINDRIRVNWENGTKNSYSKEDLIEQHMQERKFPEKWWIAVTEENRNELHEWRMAQLGVCEGYETKKCVISEKHDGTYLYYGEIGVEEMNRRFGEKITTEQFRRHVKKPKAAKEQAKWQPNIWGFQIGDEVTDGRRIGRVLEITGNNDGVIELKEGGEWYISASGWRKVLVVEDFKKYVMGADPYKWDGIVNKGQMGIYEQIKQAPISTYTRSGFTTKEFEEMLGINKERLAEQRVYDWEDWTWSTERGYMPAIDPYKKEEKIEPLPECIIVKKRKKNKKIIVV